MTDSDEEVEVFNAPVDVTVMLPTGACIMFEMYKDAYYELMQHIEQTRIRTVFITETDGETHLVNLDNIVSITTHDLGESIIDMEVDDYYEGY